MSRTIDVSFIGRAKVLLKRILCYVLFHGQHRVVIASTGRSGSTMLFDSVADGLIVSRFGIKPDTALARIIRKMTIGFVDRVSTLSSESCFVCKTHDVFDSPPNIDCKYVFLYGDPLESAMSVENVVEKEGLEWFRLHQYHLRASGDYADLYKKDVLNYENQLTSWFSESGRGNVLCVDYDSLWESVDEISRFVGFRITFPPRRPRLSKSVCTDIDGALFERLRDLKGTLKEQYEGREGSAP